MCGESSAEPLNSLHLRVSNMNAKHLVMFCFLWVAEVRGIQKSRHDSAIMWCMCLVLLKTCACNDRLKRTQVRPKSLRSTRLHFCNYVHVLDATDLRLLQLT